MKRMLAALAAIYLAACPALAEPTLAAQPTQTAAPTAGLPALTAAPTADGTAGLPALIAAATATPAPEGAPYEAQDFSCTLPARLQVLDAATQAGYDAAVQADYPDFGPAALCALSESGDAALTITLQDSTQDALTAAQEAAMDILGDGAGVTEVVYESNHWAAFACGMEEKVYSLYFLSSGEKLLVLGVSGLEDAELSMVLGSMRFA